MKKIGHEELSFKYKVKEKLMKNYYSTVKEVVLSFSDIEVNSDGFETIYVRFERSRDSGFDYSEWKLPCISCYKSFGFSEDETMEQERYLRNNSPLIWDIAKEESENRVA